jgi:hypothetical protein
MVQRFHGCGRRGWGITLEAMMSERIRKHVVELSAEQREELLSIAKSGSMSARAVRRARILLLSDADHPEGRRPDWQIAEIVELTEKQVKRVRQQFVTSGVELTLARKTRSDSGQSKVFDGPAEAKLVTLCCSRPPAGRQQWTLELLADELCRMKVVASVCPETVRQCLKKTASNRGRPAASAFPKRTGPASWPRWKRSSTSTPNRTTRPAR